MVKIFNIDMAEHFLTYNKDRKLYKCGLYDENTFEEVSLDDIKKIKQSSDSLYAYRYFTEDLGGAKWVKYAELDIFEIDPTVTFQSYDAEREFLAMGYNKVISILQNKLNDKDRKIHKLSESIHAYEQYNNDIIKSIKKFIKNIDLPENIIIQYYDMYSDVVESDVGNYTHYKSDNNIFIIPIEYDELCSRIVSSFIDPFTSDPINGYYCMFECELSQDTKGDENEN